jgi:antitoxin PrlF
MNVQHSKIISGGRIQVPAEIRKQLGLADGDPIVIEVKDNELRVRSQREAIRRVQELLKPYWPKDGEMLLSDELIADRRREAEND